MPDAEVFHVDFHQGTIIEAANGNTNDDKRQRYSANPLINDAVIAVAAVDSCYDLLEQGLDLTGVYEAEVRASEALDRLDQAQAQEAIQLARGTLF